MLVFLLALVAQSTPAAQSDATASPPSDVRSAPSAAPSLDTPIEQLIADPRAKAVLDRDLPGMSADENLDKFKAMTLKQLQPQTGGQLTDTLLAKVGADLMALDRAAPAGTPRKRREVGR